MRDVSGRQWPANQPASQCQCLFYVLKFWTDNEIGKENSGVRNDRKRERANTRIYTDTEALEKERKAIGGRWLLVWVLGADRWQLSALYCCQLKVCVSFSRRRGEAGGKRILPEVVSWECAAAFGNIIVRTLLDERFTCNALLLLCERVVLCFCLHSFGIYSCIVNIHLTWRRRNGPKRLKV